jgi:valyl-tRNA synthetase
MSLSKRYNPDEIEPRLCATWQALGVYQFSPGKAGPVYSIDTPPATVSGFLHLGHVYSYSHPDFVARFWRMRGYNVFYPMGYDDNGLPTERLVEKRQGITASEIGRAAFIETCLKTSREAESEYQALWQRLGLSIDWRHTYRTIDERSRRTSQLSFIDLYRKGFIYRSEAPAIWCPECHTALAQADLNDLERQSEFVSLKFRFADQSNDAADAYLVIATTRPELLPACVAVFVHPEDRRYRHLAGNQHVPILLDPDADPEKGSGAVMCCTFGDATDVSWWRKHRLPLVEAVDVDGRMTSAAKEFASLTLQEAHRRIRDVLNDKGLTEGEQTVAQSVRVHERCDTPIEYIVTKQWFIQLLEFKDELLEAGDRVGWHPEHMRARYRAWVENLNWDWCISRQRDYGVPFPLWYCGECGEVVLAEESQLPVDPKEQKPLHPCGCGSTRFLPEEDVLDTWATSSLTPQIVGRWLPEEGSESNELIDLYGRVFPFSLRPQAHEIIRTWAFYTLVKSHFQFDAIPWEEVLISGWGISGEGMGKISKSRGGGPMGPMEMIERYSADAVRYWAASTGPGKDSVISEEKIQMGARLATKLWNVARFSERFLNGYAPSESEELPLLTLADGWILSRLQRLIRRATQLMQEYEYAAAKGEIESFFWRELADNYLEMCKQRLYDQESPYREGARYSLYQVLLNTLKLFAPFLPYVTEQIFQNIFKKGKQPNEYTRGEEAFADSIHTSSWPVVDPELESESYEALGETLVGIATAVRRYKSERNLPLGSEIEKLQLSIADGMEEEFQAAIPDLTSITRARQVEIVARPDPGLEQLVTETNLRIYIEL